MILSVRISWTCELTLVMQSIATMNLKHVTLLSADVINGEYVVRYTLLFPRLFQKVILLRNVLLGVSLVANAILLRYVTRCISNALLLTVK